MQTNSLPQIESHQTYIGVFRKFLAEIGISVQEKVIEGETFLPGLQIENGILVYDPQKLLYTGDLLHEAGHIAVTEKEKRDTLNGNVIEDDPNKGGEEMSVMLWTYAVCKKLDIPLDVVFHPHGYKGSNEWLMENYENGTFVGLPLMKWMGLTDDEFPKMIKWVRD
jgi:hypothetical protein